MLRFFAKLERSRNFVLIIFCALLLIGLIAFYIPTQYLGPGVGPRRSSDDNVVIAKVGSQEITLGEYKSALLNRLSAFGGGNPIPLTVARSIGFDKDALDQLISGRLVLDLGSELNLTGSNSEVNDAIKRSFAGPDGNFIGKNEYLRQLRLRGATPDEVETNQRDNITARKVRD